MPEMFSVTALIMGRVRRGCRSDDRREILRRITWLCRWTCFPGSTGWRPIAFLQDGDIITIDSVTQDIRFDVTNEELEQRRMDWVKPPQKYTTGVLAKYAKLLLRFPRGGDGFGSLVWRMFIT